MNQLRWLAVLPASLLASFLVMFPWHLIVLFMGDSWLIALGGGVENVERLGYGFLTPFTIITVSAKVAPHKKALTGKVFAGLLCIVVIIGFLVWSVDYFQEARGLEKLYPVVLTPLQLLGIYLGVRQVKNS